jgi:hypothetical protein
MVVNTGISDNKDFIEYVEEMPAILSRTEMESRSVLIALGVIRR